MVFVTLYVSFVTFVALFASYRVFLAYNLRLKASKHGCEPARRFKHYDPIFGLDNFMQTGDAITKNRFLEEHQRRYDTYGHTYEALNLGSRIIYSVHPDNVRATFSKNATDWGIQPVRMHNMQPFCGTGFITTDGPTWKVSHDLLKPGFHKSVISDFAPLEEKLQIMLERIPTDGSKFDLQPWIFKLYLDLNTMFLFGESIGMLSGSPPPHAVGFLDAFQEGFNGCGMRIAFGPLGALLPKTKWLKACKKTHDFADVYVERALQYREKFLSGQRSEDDNLTQRTLLYNMAKLTENRTVLRDQIVQAMMAASETTGSLISTIFHLLSKHPFVLKKLRAEVLVAGDSPLDFDRLGQMKYLQNVIQETLRLYPVFPQNTRVALRDTILPTGGGDDGMSPVFAAAGTLFDTCFATIHRDSTIWGADALDFRPERWNGNLKPSTYEFMPFGAGLRQCLGQQKATMETSYIVVRMLQEFGEIKSEDDRPWQGQVALTAKNANGCFISVKPAASL